MKKISTLLVALVVTVASFAADRKPSVTIMSSHNYEVVVDGKSFFTNGNFISLDNLRWGQHIVKVYEVKRGFWGKKSRVVSASTFTLRDNDIRINVDRFGNVQIAEQRGRDNDNRGRDKGGYNDRDRNDRNYNGGRF